MDENIVVENSKNLNPNTIRNLKQFQNMSDASFAEYLEQKRDSKVTSGSSNIVLLVGISMAILVIGYIIWEIYKRSKDET